MNSTYHKVNVIGLGYVGLPTAAMLATNGFDVIGVEVNADAVASINAGQPHFVEAALDTLLQAVVASGKLRATSEPEPADCFVIAVPTPLQKADRQADLSHVEAAAQSIAPLLSKGNLVILESTSPVGTTERICQILAQQRSDLALPNSDGDTPDIHVAHCPERVMPGRVLRELVENDRIIGGITLACAEAAREFYRTFVQGECVLTDARTAELAKLAENAYRDVNIAFANELALVCDSVGVDVWRLIQLSNRHPRVNILQPGPGVGGHCIAVDPWFLAASAPHDTHLIRTARQVNDDMPRRVADKVLAAAQSRSASKIACLGLAFKPDIDDLRQSPAVEVVRLLAEQSASEILAVEPHIDALPAELAALNNVCLAELDEALSCAKVVVLLVHHRQFADFKQSRLSGKAVIDTRGVWKQP